MHEHFIWDVIWTLYLCLSVILYYAFSKIVCVIVLYCTHVYLPYYIINIQKLLVLLNCIVLYYTVIVSEFMSMHSSYEFAKNLQNYVINHKSNLNINLSCCLSGNNRIFNTLICTNFFCSKIYSSSNLSYSFFFLFLFFSFFHKFIISNTTLSLKLAALAFIEKNLCM